MTDQATPNLLKPNRNAFILMQLINALLQIVVGVGGSAVLAVFLQAPGILIFSAIGLVFSIFGNAFGIISSYISYQKESYKFEPGKVVATTGGLFSDNTAQLNLQNITQVVHTKKFLENLLFGTGYISLETAGSSGTEVYFRSVSNSDELYRKLLQDIDEAIDKDAVAINYEKDSLLVSEQPSLIGVAVDAIRWFGFSLSAIIIFNDAASTIFTALTGEFGLGYQVLAIFSVIGALVGIIIGLILKFLDLSRRDYQLFNQSVVYKEGFLTKHFSVIALSNVSDINITQNFIQRLVGIADIALSTKGAANDIRFSNIPNAENFERTVEARLVELRNEANSEKHNSDKTDVNSNVQTSTVAVMGDKLQNSQFMSTHSTEIKRKFDYDITGEYRLNLMRSLIGSIVFTIFLIIVAIPFVLIVRPGGDTWFLSLLLIVGIIIFMFIASLVSAIITRQTNTYSLTSGGIAHRFAFLNKSNREFGLERLTMIVRGKTLIDRLLSTSIYKFASIGSGYELTFQPISDSNNLLEDLLTKLGLNSKQNKLPIHTQKPVFSLWVWVLQSSYSLIFLLIASLVTLTIGLFSFNFILLAIGILILVSLPIQAGWAYLYNQTVNLEVYDDYIYYRGGILFLTEKYMIREYIKDIETIKYPLVDYGTLIVNVAGDRFTVDSSTSDTTNVAGPSYDPSAQLQASFSSRNVIIKYLPEISDMDDFYDAIFILKPDNLDQSSNLKQKLIEKLDTTEEYMTSPVLWNLLLPQLIAGILIFPLLPFVILSALEISRRKYILEPYRIVAKTGLFFKKQLSIRYTELDHTQSSQGFLNKVFNTGNVFINTEGSSSPELVVPAIQDYNEFYEKLNQKYN